MDLMSKVESIAGNIVFPVSHEKVKVSFSKGILPEFAKTYVSAMNTKLSYRGSSLQFDAIKLQKYLNTILKYRIDSVNGSRNLPPHARRLMVPALYALSITQVGVVYDKDLGVELTPVLDKDFDDFMSDEEAINFSRELLIVEDLGFELVEGLPRDQKGGADFMYFHMSETSILRHDKKAHPGIAVLTAFFHMKQLENVLSFRVSYGLISEYEEMLKGLIYDELR